MEGVAGCFHLAAIASVERGVREWRETHRVHLSAFVALLDAARAAGARAGGLCLLRRRLWQQRRAAARRDGGDAAAFPPMAPTSWAASCRRGSPGRCTAYRHLGLRFFNVYGVRQDPASPYSGVISIFADRLLRGEALTVFGDGLQSRDFVHVSEVVAALRAGMGRADTAAPVFNVCAGRSTTVLETGADPG